MSTQIVECSDHSTVCADSGVIGIWFYYVLRRESRRDSVPRVLSDQPRLGWIHNELSRGWRIRGGGALGDPVLAGNLVKPRWASVTQLTAPPIANVRSKHGTTARTQGPRHRGPTVLMQHRLVRGFLFLPLWNFNGFDVCGDHARWEHLR